MDLLNKENLLTAQYMYYQRLGDLKVEVQRLIRQGIALGEEWEEETLACLGALEEEVRGIEECIALLNHLLDKRGTK